MQASYASPSPSRGAALPDFSVFAWVRRTADFATLESQVRAATVAAPLEMTEYQSTVYFHWPAADLDEAMGIVDALLPVAKHPELILLQIMSRVYGQEFISLKDIRRRKSR